MMWWSLKRISMVMCLTRWLKLFVFVTYCVLLYLVMYVFPHENAVSIHNQVQFLSIGSITVVVIAFVLIAVWLRLCDGKHRTKGSYTRKKKKHSIECFFCVVLFNVSREWFVSRSRGWFSGARRRAD